MAEDAAIDVEPPRAMRVRRQPRPDPAPQGVEPAPSRDPHLEVELESPAPQDEVAARLADQAKALKDRDEELARERAARADAERRAAEAAAAAGTVAAAHLTERETNLNATLESTKALVTNAQAAMKAAFDAGDMEAYAQASADFTRGNVRLENLEIEKAKLAEQKARAPAPGARRGTAPPSAEAQRWLETHPRYGVDPEYQARVQTAHNYALAMGHDLGSPEYVAVIERNLDAFYGPNHGTLEAAKANGAAPKAATPKTPRSSAAAPSRGAAVDVNNPQEYRMQHGEGRGFVRLVTLPDGRETVEGTIPSEWVSYAKATGFKAGRSGFKTDHEGAIAYAVEQLRTMRDEAQGHDTGLRVGDGGVIYR